jgi:hypothetical protein
VVPAYVDTEALKLGATADGWRFNDLLTEFYSALRAFNGELLKGEGFIGGILGAATDFSTNREIRVRQGTISTNVNAEYVDPDPQKRTSEGWMIDAELYDAALGWTWQGLAKEQSDDVRSDIAEMIRAMRDRYRIAFLERVLVTADLAIDEGAGTGYSVGVVGGGSMTYVPNTYLGKSFLSTHTHIAASATDTGAQLYTELVAMRRNLVEHGKQSREASPWLLLHSSDDIAIVEGASDGTNTMYLPFADATYRPSQLSDQANAAAAALALGAHGAIKGTGFFPVEFPGVPDNKYIALPVYPGGGGRKPLRRYSSTYYGDFAIPLGVEPGRPGVDIVEKLGIVREVGFGVQEREGFGVIQLGDASYDDPTSIS